MPIRRQTAEADLRVVEAHKQSAHTDCTPACRVDMIDYDVDKGHILVSTRAVSARVNLNYDGFTSAELKKSYRSFVGKPIYVNHVNYDPMRTRGVIVGANYHEHGDDKFVECLMDVDGNAFPKLAEEIVEGNIDSVSMGASVQSTTCSVCGKNMVEVDDFCDHVAHHKGQMIYSANEGHDVLCYETLVSPSFFELSFVFDPADTTALTQNVKAASVKASYEDDPAVPPKVDTEGEEPCPDCGNDLWDGEVCEVCGYVAPPEGLDDPDLQKNKEIEVREPEDDPAEDVESDKDDKKEAAMTNTRKIDVRASRRKRASIPNAIYHNADGTDELVVLDSGDNVVEVIRTLDIDESNEILTGASDEFERVPGWDSSFPIGDGDIVQRIQPVGFDDTVMYAKRNRKAKMNNKNRRTDIRASRTKKASKATRRNKRSGLINLFGDQVVNEYLDNMSNLIIVDRHTLGYDDFNWILVWDNGGDLMSENDIYAEGYADTLEEAQEDAENAASQYDSPDTNPYYESLMEDVISSRDYKTSLTKKATALNWKNDAGVSYVSDILPYSGLDVEVTQNGNGFEWVVYDENGLYSNQGTADTEESAKKAAEEFLRDEGVVTASRKPVSRKKKAYREQKAIFADVRQGKASRKGGRKKISADWPYYFTDEYGYFYQAKDSGVGSGLYTVQVFDQNGDLVKYNPTVDESTGDAAIQYMVDLVDFAVSRGRPVASRNKANRRRSSLRKSTKRHSRKTLKKSVFEPFEGDPDFMYDNDSKGSFALRYKEIPEPVWVLDLMGDYENRYFYVSEYGSKESAKQAAIDYYNSVFDTLENGIVSKRAKSKKAAVSGQFEDDAVTQALETILWFSTDEDGTPLDATYNIYDFDNASFQTVASMVKNFISKVEDFDENLLDNYSPETIGHDFILKVLHSGSGFDNDTLDNIAGNFPEFDVYVGDDGKVYL